MYDKETDTDWTQATEQAIPTHCRQTEHRSPWSNATNWYH